MPRGRPRDPRVPARLWGPERKAWINRDRHLRRTYGLTTLEYIILLERQGGGCAICGDSPPYGQNLAVDHDHRTGRIRGILCRSCNWLLDRYGRGADWFRQAGEYLANAERS